MNLARNSTSFFFYFALTFLPLALSNDSSSSLLQIWPEPTGLVTTGILSINVSPLLTITGADTPDVVDGVTRFLSRAFLHPISSSTSLHKLMNKLMNKNGNTSILSRLVLNVTNGNTELGLGVDESYSLFIPSESSSSISLTSETQFGLYAGLETLSQLFEWDAETRSYSISSVPILINDSPKFSWRGLLIDTARHFQSLSSLYAILDSMTMVKLNILHWHIVDAQSWPLESILWPNLWLGAFSKSERYTTDDVLAIVEYARKRGIRIVFEVDHPGHLSSSCKGYPNLCPSDCVWDAGDNSVPLAPANNSTWMFLNDTVSELAILSSDLYLHLGGDEVDTTCWSLDTATMNWVKERNITVNDIYSIFVQHMNTAAIALGKIPIRWEDAWIALGTSLDLSTIIHVWLSQETLGNVTSHGYKAIYSYQGVYNDIFDYQNGWYLNGLWQNWKQMYDVDILGGIKDGFGNKSLVLGGEGAQWGEEADGSDILQTIWPRLAAIAERLWSYNMEKNSSDIDVGNRLSRFRCLLLERGIPATPLNSLIARSPPSGPGSCYIQ
jgi:hexosaminidase